MTRTDWRIAAMVVAIWALAVAASAAASSVADLLGTARQAHAFHTVSFGLLVGGFFMAVGLSFIAGVIAFARIPGVRGGIRRRAGTLRTGSAVRMSPRSIKGER